MLFVQENYVYTFVYNGKNRVAIVLEINDKQALCWELTVNQFRRYNIKDIQSPTDITHEKVLRFGNEYFSQHGSTTGEVRKYYDNINCLVFFGDEYTFVVNNQYLTGAVNNWGNPVSFSCTEQFHASR